MAELTEEQIREEEEFLRGVPRINLGALILAPIWGPAHGMWVSILFYPLWMFADNVFYAAYTERTIVPVAIAVVMAVLMVGLCVAFSLVSQPFALHRAVAAGKTKKQYLLSERKWSMVCVAIAFLVIILATYYNLVVRPTVGA